MRRIDNLDLANRRNRLGLSQQDIADAICGEPIGSKRGFHYANVSRFETAKDGCDSMPPVHRGGPRTTRADYVRALEPLEAEAKDGAA